MNKTNPNIASVKLLLRYSEVYFYVEITKKENETLKDKSSLNVVV